MMKMPDPLITHSEQVRWVIVPAAGRGRRMGAALPKQYLPLANGCVLSVTLARLHQAWPSAQLLLCLSPDDAYFDPAMLPEGIRWRRVDGGKERADSVWHAVQALAEEAAQDELVAVHDVARPCVHVSDLRVLTKTLAGNPVGGLLATPVADTMKRATADNAYVQCTENRDNLWHALTPQLFRYGLLHNAMRDAYQRTNMTATGMPFSMTDEASAVEALGYAPLLVPGRRDNLKITHPQDLALAEHIIAAQQELPT